jgi:hypothetical protein
MPLFNEEGGEVLTGARRLDTAKALLKESGYAGAPVTLMVAQDIASSKAWGGVAADLLTRLGMTVDYVATNRSDLAGSAGAGRLAHLSHRRCGRRLHRSDQRVDSRQRRSCGERVAGYPAARRGGRQLVLSKTD